MGKGPSIGRIWRWHVLLGVPLAAFLHSIVQFAYDTSTKIGDLGYFVFHFGLGILVGSVILVPAYTAQAFLFRWLRSRGVAGTALVLGCGAFQVGLVGLWWLAVGIEPSLGGRFRMGPVMMLAGFVAGAIVAAETGRRLRRETAPSS